MTKKEFDEESNSLACRLCDATGSLRAQKGAPPHEWEVKCQHCGRSNGYLKMQKNKDKRPALKPGTIDMVWKEYGNHCAHCGLSAKQIQELGICRTVQHVPPYKDAGHTGKLIPLCVWCQIHSADIMKRLTALLKTWGKHEND